MNLHPDGHRPSGCFFDSPGASHGIKIEMYLFDKAVRDKQSLIAVSFLFVHAGLKNIMYNIYKINTAKQDNNL